MSDRKLTEDEKKLWRKITRTVHASADKAGEKFENNPLGHQGNHKHNHSGHIQAACRKRDGFDPKPAKISQINSEQTNTEKADTKHIRHKRSFMALTPVAKRVNSKPVENRQITQDKKVRRGRVQIDAKIDLHDLFVVEAEIAFYDAVSRAHARGHRTLLVVTGKGVRLEGKIRQALPGWVNDVRVRAIIATFAPAHVRHGGTGAWYIFLKRNRSE